MIFNVMRKYLQYTDMQKKIKIKKQFIKHREHDSFY